MITYSFIDDSDTVNVITLAEAKKHLRVEPEYTDEDTLIDLNIGAAQNAAANFIGRAIGKRKLVIELDKFTSSITFESSSNESVEKVEYYQPGETELTVLNAETYWLQKTELDVCKLVFTSLPATAVRNDAVIVTVYQGFEAEKCPLVIKQAILLLTADFFERREDREQSLNSAAKNLLRSYRKY